MRKLALVMFLFLLPRNSHAQELYKRHPWEFNVSVYSIRHDVSWVSPRFMLKRNVGQSNKLGAWRIVVSPFARFTKTRYWLDSASTNKHKHLQFMPTVQLGYEWQKRVAKSMAYYGVDVGWFERLDKGKLTFDPWDSNQTYFEAVRTRDQIDIMWLSGFAGIKHYITHRYSVSIESQLQLKYNVTSITHWGEGVQVAQDIQRTMNVEPFLYYFVTLSYNF